jgi:3-dehydroquinate dehydratase-2
LKILIINGPNLNLIGIREPDIYGSESLSDIENWLNDQPEADGHSITWFQSNHEGELIDFIHGAMGNVGGIVINPGAFTHYSYAIRDAIAAINVPTVEVHLSDINTREDFREISVIKDVCLDQISGLGKIGYLKGIQRLIN